MSTRASMKNATYVSLIVLTGLLGVASTGVAQQTAKSKSTVVLASEVQWTPLNPARGDKSPQAATLWGDRKGTAATGFLVKFVDGFSSPPHIHNVTYRGVVIGGGVHNDDPDAKPMWMPPGAFWTQPAGEPHVTAARGTSIAYIEIDKGPYLVRPTEDAFDSGERPVNVAPSNLVWLDASNTSWIDNPVGIASTKNPEIAFLWGSPKESKLNGTLVKLPGGFVGTIRSSDSGFRAVVIQGQPKYHVQGQPQGKVMAPGSYFSSEGVKSHQVSCDEKESCTIYVRSEGEFRVIPD